MTSSQLLLLPYLHIPVLFIPFGVFFFCCALQFWFLRDVRRALALGQPDIWRELSTKALLIDRAVFFFALWRKDKALGDPRLTSTVKRLRLLSFIAIFAWLSFAGLMVAQGFLTAPEQAPSPYYPPSAQRMQKEGEAQVECDVVDEKRLQNCRILSETPENLGFGAAAIQRVSGPTAGIDPVLLKGRTTYKTKVSFRLN